AGRVCVEPADRDEPRLVLDQSDHGRPALRIARRRDDPARLVEQDVGERLPREPHPVELDDVSTLHEGVQLAGLTVDEDPAGPDQLVRPPARRDAGTREERIEPHGAIIGPVSGRWSSSRSNTAWRSPWTSRSVWFERLPPLRRRVGQL